MTERLSVGGGDVSLHFLGPPTTRASDGGGQADRFLTEPGAAPPLYGGGGPIENIVKTRGELGGPRPELS